MYNDADGDEERGTAESYVRYLYSKNRLVMIMTNTTRYGINSDAFGNTTGISAGNRTLATYEYAPNNGKLLKMTYGNGDYEEYVYDKLDRLVETKYNGTVENTVKYNANGAVSEITDGNVTHVYKYDSLGRLIRAYQKDSSGTVTLAVENSYDELGRAKGSTYVVDGKTLSYTLSYTSDSSLVDSVALPNFGSVQSALDYTYDELDRLVKKNISFSTMKDAYEEYDYYSYVKDGVTHTTALVSSLSLVSESGTDTYGYTYDNLGNILTVSKNGTLVESYEYDSLNQLTRENNYSAGYTKLYTYDPMGNITQKVEFAYTTAETSTLDVADGTVTSYGYGEGFGTGMYVWHDVLTSYSGTTITYDNIGNPLNWRNASEFVWSARELVSASLSNSNTVSYTYNADGIRTQKVYNNTVHNYILDGSKIIKEEVSVNGTTSYELYYIYDASGSIIGFYYNNAPYYFLKNLQGDVVSIVNAMGTVVVEYTYDAWGKLLSTTGTLASTIGTYNPFRYRGYYYDSETGWYYLQSRYYDPTVGRFLNADSIATSIGGSTKGYNLYAYCVNNPVNMVDSSGNWPKWIENVAQSVNKAVNKVKETVKSVNESVASFVNDVEEFYDKYKDSEGTLALYDNKRFDDDKKYHEQIFAVTPKSSSASNEGLTICGAEADFYKGGWETDHMDLSLLDVGHAEAEVDLNFDNGDIGAGYMASVWSPSVSFDTPIGEYGVGLECLAVGVSGGVSIDDESVTIQFASGVGFSLTFPNYFNW